MSLEIKRPIAFFDLETTGTDIVKDKIIEISILKVFPNQKKESLNFLLNPGILISDEVSKIHGITNEDVKNCPMFKDIANEIYNFLSETDLAGYNSNRFDIPLLVEEMLRCNLDMEIEKRHIVDVQVIFHTMEKRTLEAAFKFYCNKTLEGAHRAENDTLATYEILLSQLERYPELSKDVAILSESYGFGEDLVDYSKRIAKKGDDYILCFGKHKDKTFSQIKEIDPTYFKWMYQADFSLHTKLKLKEICDKKGISI